MSDRRLRFLLMSTVLLSASFAYAQPMPDGENNQVSIPEEVDPVAMKPVPPKAELLGQKKDEAPSPVVLSTDEKQKDEPKTDTAIGFDNTLRDALAYVYEHHPQLLAEREKVKAVDESVALAVSDFRPQAGLNYNKGRDRQDSNNTGWSYRDTSNKGLTVTQPIFSGGDGVAGLKSAKQRVKAARADLTALEQQVLFNAVVAYADVALAQSVLELNQNNVDVLTKQRDAAKIRFEVGELTKTDVSQSEARLANAKAAEQQAVGDLAIARATYLRSVGIPSPETPAMPEVPTILPKSIEEASVEARNASPILDAARHREKAFESDVNIRVGSILPDVSVQGSMNRSKGSSLFVNQLDNDALTLNVSIPLYQGGAEWARLREARNIASQARFTTLDTTLAVEQDVTSAWQNYVTAESVITSNKAAVDASALALEGVRQENEFGVRTILDVLDAEQEAMNAKVNLVRATRNHKIQAYRLLASVGKLTAKELTLPVKIYDPLEHYDSVKYQLLGW